MRYLDLVAASLLVAAPAAAKPTLVVAPLKRVKTEKADAETLTEMIRIRAGQSERYTLVTPEAMDAIDVELQRQLSGGCKMESCIAEIGGALGARVMITGKFSRVGMRFILLLKLIDIERVKAIRTIDVQGKQIETILDLLEPKISELLGEQSSESAMRNDLAVEGGAITGALGWINVTGKPKGAQVKLRGTAGFQQRFKLNPKKPWLRRVPQGLYRWQAKAKGRQTQRGVLWVKTDETKALNIRLKKPGTLHIKGKPKGAKVRIVGPGTFEVSKGLPVRVKGAKSGKYDVVVSRKGYRSAKKVLSVRAGKTTTWKVKLKRGTDLQIPPRVLAIWSHVCVLKGGSEAQCYASRNANDRSGRDHPPRMPLVSLAAGAVHTCGLTSQKRVICWGSNDNGQLDVPKGRYEAISAGKFHSCGLRSDGRITCWGDNESGQTKRPRGMFRSVSSGGYHNCALRLNKTIRCWGNDDHTEATPPKGIFRQVEAGQWHTCGLTKDQRIMCWGSNRYGQTRAPQGRYSNIQAGAQHSCALKPDQTVTCWGSNDYGELKVDKTRFVTIDAGRFTTCGLRANGKLACWGALAFDEAQYR